MKRNYIIAAVSALAALALAGSALAASQQQAEVQRLSVAKDRLVAGADSVKPSQAARLRNDADDLQKMIDAAQAGKKLNPADVDRAINQSYQGY